MGKVIYLFNRRFFVSEEQMEVFRTAAQHTLECRCEACQQWLAVEEENAEDEIKVPFRLS